MGDKFRDAMGKHGGRCPPAGQVEPGDGFFAVELPEDKRGEPLKL